MPVASETSVKTPSVVLPEEGAVVDPARAVVAVGGGKVDVAVVVVVEEGGAPGEAGVADAGRLGVVGESAVAVVAVEAIPAAEGPGMVGVVGDIGNEPVEIAVGVVVAEGRAHAVEVGADAGGERAVGEGAVAVVPKKLAGFEIRGEGQVHVAVAVEVDEPWRVAIGAVLAIDVDARGGGDVFEAAGLGGAKVAQQPRLRIGDEIAPVAGNEVEVAVVVVVAEAGALAAADDAVGEGRGMAGAGVGEIAAAVVEIEVIASVADGGHVEVEVAVVVDVAGDDAVGVGGEDEAGRRRAGFERAVAKVAVEDVVVVEAGEDEVDVAVAVEVARRGAAGEERFSGEDVDQLGVGMNVVDAGSGGDVGESDGGDRRRGEQRKSWQATNSVQT